MDLNGSGGYDLNEPVTFYTWDHRNRLTAVTDYGPQLDLEQKVEFTYDPHDRLVRRAVDTDGNGTIDEQTVFAHDGGQIALQFDQSGPGDLAATDLTHRYLWGPAVDMLLADEKVENLFNASLNETLWALTDNLGSVKDVVDSSGTLRHHRVLDSFGNQVGESFYDANGVLIANPATDPAALSVAFVYTGKLLDVYTDQSYHNARWLDLRTGSWLSKDFVWDGTNRYAYVGNQPTRLTDRNGLHQTLEQWYEQHGTPQPQGQVDWQYISDNYGIIGPSRPQDDAGRIRSMQLTAECLRNSDYGNGRERLRHAYELEKQAAQLSFQHEYNTNFAFRLNTQIQIFAVLGGGYTPTPSPISVRPPGGGTTQWGAPTRPVVTGPSRPGTAVAINNFLGPRYRTFTNRDGNLVCESNNGMRQVRFDFNNPHPHKNPHIHIIEYTMVKNNKEEITNIRIFPKGVQPE